MAICRLSMSSSLRTFPLFNTIDESTPIYLYLEPEILGLLLEPLFWHQEAGLYPNKYSIHDLGSSFPNATGHSDGTWGQDSTESRYRRVHARCRMRKHDLHGSGVLTVH